MNKSNYPKKYIYGYGGCGQEIKNIILRSQINNNIVFIDDNKIYQKKKLSISFESFKKENKKSEIYLGIQNNFVRENLSKKFKSNQKFLNLIDNSVILFENVKIGKGSIIWPNCVISCNTKIGNFFHMNLNCFVGHDCKIGDFVTFSPSVKCCGNVEIGNKVFIGTGATILPGSNKKIKIGNNVKIAAGAVVYDSVQNNTTVMGNPAKRIF